MDPETLAFAFVVAVGWAYSKVSPGSSFDGSTNQAMERASDSQNAAVRRWENRMRRKLGISDADMRRADQTLAHYPYGEREDLQDWAFAQLRKVGVDITTAMDPDHHW